METQAQAPQAPQYAPSLQELEQQQAQAQQAAQQQNAANAAATAGQQIQQVIVPEEDWESYAKFIQSKYPFMHVTAERIDDVTAAKNVEAGKAIQITKKKLFAGNGEGTEQGTAAFNAGNLINVPDGQVPEFLGNLAKQLGEFATEKSANVKTEGDNIMENNNNAQVQAQQQGMLAQLQAQAENVSWGRVAKGIGLVGGGVVIGKLAFGSKGGTPQAAEALMSAAETMSKADPKAIANAFGTLAKNGLTKIFGI